MFDNLDDPQKQMLLMLGAGLLSPTRNKGMTGFGEAMGKAIPQGLLGYSSATDAKRRNAMADMQAKFQQAQLGQMEQSQADEAFKRQIAPQYFNQGNAPADGMGPVSPPKMDVAGYGAALAQRSPEMGLPYLPKPQQPKMQFAPNGEAVDMNSLPVGKNFAAPQKTPDWKDPEYIKAQQAIRAAGRPQISTTTNVMPPREVFKDSLGLKKDFDSQPEVQGFKQVQGAWDQISTALQKPSPANDLAAATKFMKMLDPGSVVRESELMMAMQASGAWDRFTNTAERILKGHKLTPEQRKDFHSAGEALYSASKDRFGQTVQQYEGIAGQYGLDSRFIQNAKPRVKGGWGMKRLDD